MSQLLASVVDVPSPLLTFGILVTLYELLGTPGNLELRKRKGVAKLTFNDISLVGLVGDVDVLHAMQPEMMPFA